MDVFLKYHLNFSRSTALFIFFLGFLDYFVAVVRCVTKAEIDQHLSMGMNMLAQGQYSDALLHFHAAVDADPSNYMSRYKRATLFLALNKPKSALDDLNEVLALKSDFTIARIKRGSVFLKMGRLDEAHIDLENGLSASPDNEEATRLYAALEPLTHRLTRVDDLINGRDFHSAVEELNDIIDFIPWDPTLREQRAECYLATGNIIHAIADLRTATTKLRADDTSGYFRLANLHYSLGEPDHALTEVRECLKLDSEHPKCFPFYKKLKKVSKAYLSSIEAANEERWSDCASDGRTILKHEPSDESIRLLGHLKMCQCLLKDGQPAKARSSCGIALKIQEDASVFCDRAETYLAEDLFDEAQEDYRKALGLDEHFERAKEGLNKAQSRQKQASKRNYYKILGVSRTASKRQIVKAYRKLAKKLHPDGFQDPEEKSRAEKKFMDIAAAKEVLSDPELRKRFDDGEDPLDPEARQGGGGGHPFHGHPFGGDGDNFHFKFHFN